MTDSDRPEWMERLSDTIGDARPPRYLIQALMPEEYRPLITRAARSRGIPVSAYLRRAVLAFVAHDLGIDFFELAQNEPGVVERRGLTPRRMRGEGFGRWRIGRLD